MYKTFVDYDGTKSDTLQDEVVLRVFAAFRATKLERNIANRRVLFVVVRMPRDLFAS